ncbi:protein of unknown function (plasmid) [Shinella sp. WSC3-e]|nr:hypothetical protein SHINE37_110244 [Rhizobiaceae bacterium]CAK7260692.1 protein of unknown function [Shinella sp. WSC3-e]
MVCHETPELFIFDCDGVLVDSEILSVRAYVRAYARHGLAIAESDVARCFGMKQADIFQSIGAATRQVFPPEHAGDLWEEIRTLLEAELVAIEGIDRLLDTLPAKRCVASSSAPERIALSLSLRAWRSASARRCSARRWSGRESRHRTFSSTRPPAWAQRRTNAWFLRIPSTGSSRPGRPACTPSASRADAIFHPTMARGCWKPAPIASSEVGRRRAKHSALAP